MPPAPSRPPSAGGKPFDAPCSIMTSFCWREAGGAPAPSRPPSAGGKLVVPLLHHDLLLLERSWCCPCSIMTSFCWREAGGAPAPSRPPSAGGKLVVPPAPSRPPSAGAELVLPLLHYDLLLLEGIWWCPCSITTSFCWREAGGTPAPSRPPGRNLVVLHHYLFLLEGT